MRTMLDGIIVGNVTGAITKQRATIAAGYVNGTWPDYDQIVAKTPSLLHLSITVNALDTDALCLDVEDKDATPSEAPGWVLEVRAKGKVPWVYMNESTWPAVRQAFHDANVAEPHYWVANYDGDPTIPAGAVAKQHTTTLGYDISSVVEFVDGFDTDPFKGHSDMEEDMPMIEPLSVHPGEYAYGIDESHGLSEVVFNVDGYGAQVELRVVIWGPAGPDVVEGVTIGGPTGAPSDHQHTVKFPDPATTYGVTVRRMDHTGIPIGVVFR